MSRLFSISSTQLKKIDVYNNDSSGLWREKNRRKNKGKRETKRERERGEEINGKYICHCDYDCFITICTDAIKSQWAWTVGKW